jgi:DNA-binding LytR/AlgR family response regulator
MSERKAVIAEDEPLLRAELRETLAKLWPELAICAEAEDGVEALHAIELHAPDVLFLDIQMPAMSGLEVARHAGNRCHIVFVTAYDKYAVTAFEQGAVDYVMKPFTPARLATTIGRLKDKMGTTPANLERLLQTLLDRNATREYLRWVTASQGQELRLITVEEICYFQADNKYTLVVTPTAQALINKPIKELIDELDPETFLQIHRGTVVNVNAVAAVHRDRHGRMSIQLKQRPESLQVSASFAHLFRQM